MNRVNWRDEIWIALLGQYNRTFNLGDSGDDFGKSFRLR